MAEGCSFLSSALKSNTSYLQELDLSKNNLQQAGAKMLSDTLESKTTGWRLSGQ